jgi:hypothetical protein
VTVVTGAGVVIAGAIVRAMRALLVEEAAAAKTGTVTARIKRRRIQYEKRGCRWSLMCWNYIWEGYTGCDMLMRKLKKKIGGAKAMKWYLWHCFDPNGE